MSEIIGVEDYLKSIGAKNYLLHYGTPRHSGRYPWGSGGEDAYNPDKRNKSFLDHVADLRNQGMTEAQIAKGMDITTTQLRAAKSIAKNAQKAADIAFAERLKEKGYSNGAIAERMGLPGESSVRALLAPGVKDRADVLQTTADMLKQQVEQKGYVDIGTAVERQLGISKEKLATAAAILKEQGYEIHTVQVDQLGTTNKTAIKVLAPPGTTYRDIASNTGAIKSIQDFSEDGGRSYLGIHPPLPISPKRVGVRYAEEGGADADGVIYVRPGVHDVSIGNSRYAQVRIQVGDNHYLKGMAIYKDDLPPGVDLLFNTNKSNTGNKLDAMKKLKDEPDNPFGATVRQRVEIGKDGKPKVTSVMNIVGLKEGANEEGGWDLWSRNLPSQFLSKQSSHLAKSQLDMTYERRKTELDDILRLTNPAVRKKLLESFADATDSASVHLKAASLPRQSTHVLLPVPSLKDNEVYAPNFQNGEKIVLVRFPHGGIFELPELTVNNNHPQAKALLGRALDAVGINPRVAEKLSGADFDGDTVLAIPNNQRKIQTKDSLSELKHFDPKDIYKPYDGMKTMAGGTWDAKRGEEVFPPGKKASGRTKGFEMGDVSNLITDMTIKGASDSELARAVRHSMVVIDAEKHVLNWRQSAIDNGIKALKQKYQARPDGSAGGASTLISRASSRIDIRKRKAAPASENISGGVDKRTGEKVFVETGEHWIDARGRTKYRTERSTKLAEAKDAHSLSSGTAMEKVYADHSNRLKALANEARKAAVNTRPTPISDSAKKVYANEVKSLDAKLNIALKNAPRERQAQVLANAVVRAKKDASPDMDPDALKKIKAQALNEARLRTGAKKEQVDITPDEWAAIQAGAISNSKLVSILNNANIEKVKELATPKTTLLMSPVKTSRAKAMAAQGYTQAEIADALGVSLTTLKTALSGGGS